MKRVLLIGGSGQLGSAIRRAWSDCEVTAPAHADLSFECTDALTAAIDRLQPAVVLNACAFHDVDRCEAEPERAFAVNALAVGRAARAARDRDLVFVTISTDYVFDGTRKRPYRETDAVHPISAYGASKLAGEHLVERLGARAFVVRTCGMYGDGEGSDRKPSFVGRVFARARSGEPMRIVGDVVASPTYAGHLARAIRELIETQAYGLYHAADSGAVSWYEFAAEALRQAGLEATVERISRRQQTAPAARPAFSALDSAKLRQLGVTMPSWRDGLAAYVGAMQVSARNPAGEVTAGREY